MEDLRDRIKDAGETMSDIHFVTQMLNALTKGYDNEVRMIEREVDLGQTVTVEDLKERLSLIYKQMQSRGYKEEDDDIPEDIDENAFLAPGRYKGKCGHCGEYGHKSSECPNKTRSGNKNEGSRTKQFKGRCNWCGIYGHKEEDCRKKKAGKPRTANEQASFAAEDEEGSFMYMDTGGTYKPFWCVEQLFENIPCL